LRRPQLPLPHVTSNAAYFRLMRQRDDQKTVRTYCAAVQTNVKPELLQDRHIDMYDTTLRDGAQMVSASFSKRPCFNGRGGSVWPQLPSAVISTVGTPFRASFSSMNIQ
jgi:hypothetical protein